MKIQTYKKYSRGITLIEMLVVIAITILISTLVFRSFSTYRNEQIFKTTVESVSSLFSQARLQTAESLNASQYGVHIETSRVVLFKGASFSEPSSDNRLVTLDSSLSITSISLNGGTANVVFDRLTGATTNYGTFNLGITSDSTKTRTFTIIKTGIVSAN